MSSSAAIDDVTNLLKNYYTDFYTDGTNWGTPLKAQFAKLPNANFAGNLWIFATKAAWGGGSANAGVGKSLPPSGNGVVAQGQMSPVYTYTRLGISGPRIAASKYNKGAFKQELAFAMDDRMKMHDLEVNRQMFCNADGVLATIPTGTTSATQTPGTGVGGAVGDYGQVNAGSGMKHINVGDELAFYQSDKTSFIARQTVTAVTGTTFTVDASFTSTDGAVITRATADTDNIAAGEANGLLAACQNSGMFENIDPATYGQVWKAIVQGNSGTLRDITNALVLHTVTQIRTQSRQTPNLAVTSPGIPLKYSEQFLPLQRIDGQDVALKGGYKPLVAILTAGAPIPVIDDPDCPNCRLFLLTTSTMLMADLLGGTDWLDDDGQMMVRTVGQDGVEATVRKYWNLAYLQRNALGVINDINDYTDINRLGN